MKFSYQFFYFVPLGLSFAKEGRSEASWNKIIPLLAEYCI